jgi:cytochrome c-type biogenesis protein CcmH
MLFIVLCVALLLAVLAAVGLPLLSGAHVLPSRGQYDRAVYRDQLREVDRDVARGVLNPAEAGAARLEIQRRLLAVDGTGGVGAMPAGGMPTGTTPAGAIPTGGMPVRAMRSPLTAIAAMVFVALGTGGLYLRLGAPGLPDVPFADRPVVQADAAPPVGEPAAAPHNGIREAAALLEQKLAADPSNANGWVLYARAVSMLGEWSKASDAYKHAIDLGRKSGDVMSGYGEMQVMAADGIVSPAARDAFLAALAADGSNGVARYYLALADGQAGLSRKAVDAWLELATGLPDDSPMREEIARRIAEAAKSGGFDAPPMPKGLPAEAAAPGPTQEQMEAAAAMPPAERDKMISGMIDKLAAKLREQPDDLEGWTRLGGAYAAQGKTDQAVAAYDHAAALKPGDPAIKLRTVAALLSGLRPDDKVPPRAIALLTEVAAVAPDAPEVLWYLGVAAARDGRPAEARENWTKLLTSLPADGEDSKMVRTALEELKRR